jgi:hypothetical protein
MGQQGSTESHVRMLRSWHLAILRFAVTLDNVDQLSVLAIANEIDRFGRQHVKESDFNFFRRTSAELCAAIPQRNEDADAVLRQYLARIDDIRVKRALVAAVEVDEAESASIKPRSRSNESLWRGLTSRGDIRR